MKSVNYIDDLRQIPCDKKFVGLKSLVKEIELQKKESMAIEIGIATEVALLCAFDELNVDDKIAEGFASQYPNLAENQSLYQDLLAKGADTDIENLTSYIDRIKGKIYEIELTDRLGEQFDGYTFSIAESATQPIWDIKGVNADGQEILVQAKMGGENYAYEVKDRMLENPDVLFATSTEIQNKILENHPELASQFVNIDISNAEFSAQITENVEQLIGNYGVDTPDSMTEVLSFVGEIVAGITLLREMSKVKDEYKGINQSDANKIKMLRAIMVISRFGVTSIAALIGTAIFPVVGTIAAILAARMINNEIKPYMYDMALDIMGYTIDDMFYFKNKTKIDKIGYNLSQSRLLLS